MTALSIQPTYPIFTDIDGQPLEDGYVWIGVANLAPIGNPINVYWDAALTIPAVQPIRTRGGYPMNSGTPARLYVNSNYSIQVQNKNGSAVYSAAAVTERYNDAVINISSTNVSFVQAGSGAVTRTSQDKMRDWLSVKDFGATGDGVTDDTAAIQLAFNAANGTKAVMFPDGSYKVTSSIDCKASSFFGQSMYQTIILCHLANARAFTNTGRNIYNLAFHGTGFPTADAFEIGGYLNNINNCYFYQLRDSICPINIIVTSTVNQCLFLGCNSAINDKLHDGTSAHTTLWFTSNSVQYGVNAFVMKTEAAGMYFSGNVFEQLEYVYYAFGNQLFNDVWIKNWIEQVYTNLTIFHNTFAGGTSVKIMNDIRPGPMVITDSNKMNPVQFAGTGAGGNSGGVTMTTSGIRISNFNATEGFIYDDVGISPAAAEANFVTTQDLTLATMSGNATQATRGGDVVGNFGLGSYGQRRGCLRSSVDAANNLGDASFRWNTVYASVGAINTSDANEKEQVEDLSDAEKAVALAIKSKIKKFKFKDAVALKGDGARIHVGAIAQEVEQAFSDSGLDASRYGIFCRDVWYTTMNNETGKEEHVYPDADGNYPVDAKRHERLGLRYEELLAFVIAAI